MKCPSCGSYVQDGAMFCTACGGQMAPGPDGQYGAPPPPPVAPGHQQFQPQQPYGHLPQYAPPPKDDTSSGLKVVAVVIVIAVVSVTVLAAVFWMGFTGIITEEPIGMITVNIASPNVQQRLVSDVVHYDAVLNINKITPRDTLVFWTSVEMIIKAADGSVLMTRTVPLPDDPTMYDDAANGWVEVEVWFIDVSSDIFVDAGDALKITGMDERYEGSYVEITYKGDRIGSITLPTDFS